MGGLIEWCGVGAWGGEPGCLAGMALQCVKLLSGCCAFLLLFERYPRRRSFAWLAS